MITRVFIEPHERQEAVDAYREVLTAEQIAEILDAPDEALLSLKIDALGAQVVVIPEG